MYNTLQKMKLPVPCPTIAVWQPFCEPDRAPVCFSTFGTMGKRAKGVVATDGAASAPSKDAGAELPVRQRRKLEGRRTLEEKALRGISLHFPWLAQEKLASVTVDGKTLKERIMEDHARLDSGKQSRLSASYWRGLVAEYGAQCNPVMGLDIEKFKGKDNEVSQQVKLATDAATTTDTAKRSPEALLALLAGQVALTKREMLGVCKSVEAHSGVGKHAVSVLWLAIGKHITTFNYSNCLEDLKTALIPRLDMSMDYIYGRWRKAGVLPEVFVQQHMPLLKWVLPAGHFELAWEKRKNWKQAAGSIRACVAEAQIGATLFEGVLGKVDANGLELDVTTALQDINLQTFGAKEFMEFKAMVDTKWKDYDQSPQLNSKRLIKVDFCQQLVEVQVNSVSWEVELRLMAFLKTQAIFNRHIIPMEMEQWVLEDKMEKPNYTFFKNIGTILDGAVACRAAVSNILEEVACQSVDSVLEVLEGQVDMLLTMDRSWTLEASFLKAHLSELVTEKCQEMILARLPQADFEQSQEEVLKELNALQDLKLFKVGGVCITDSLNAITTVISNMVRKLPCPVKPFSNSTPFWQKVCRACCLFVSFWKEEKTSKTQPKEVEEGQPPEEEIIMDTTFIQLFGAEALKEKWEAMKRQHSSQEEEVKLADLDIFYVHQWMLLASQVDELKAMTAELLPGAKKEGGAVKKAAKPVKASGVQQYF